MVLTNPLLPSIYTISMTYHRFHCTVKQVNVFERRKIQCSTLFSFSNLNLVIKTPYLRESSRKVESIGNNRDTLPSTAIPFCNCDCCFRNTIWNYFSTAQGYLDRPFNCFGKHLGMSIPSFLVLFYLLGYLGLSYKIHSFKYDGVCMR
jgi:hypothetical protein